jgi:hypothetical protein
MLYHLLYPLHQDYAVFNVLSVHHLPRRVRRAHGAGDEPAARPLAIRTLAAWRVGQQIRAEGPRVT